MSTKRHVILAKKRRFNKIIYRTLSCKFDYTKIVFSHIFSLEANGAATLRAASHDARELEAIRPARFRTIAKLILPAFFDLINFEYSNIMNVLMIVPQNIAFSQEAPLYCLAALPRHSCVCDATVSSPMKIVTAACTLVELPVCVIVKLVQITVQFTMDCVRLQIFDQMTMSPTKFATQQLVIFTTHVNVGERHRSITKTPAWTHV